MNLGYENFGWFPSSCCISIETQWTTRVKMTGGRFSDPLHPSRSIASILIVIECALKRVLEREKTRACGRGEIAASASRDLTSPMIFSRRVAVNASGPVYTVSSFKTTKPNSPWFTGWLRLCPDDRPVGNRHPPAFAPFSSNCWRLWKNFSILADRTDESSYSFHSIRLCSVGIHFYFYA